MGAPYLKNSYLETIISLSGLHKALKPPRPVGLIETNVGGTPDQRWSSPDALAQCKNLGKPWEWPANFTDSVLWNGMVVPLLRTTIKGAVWMQGEANSRADGRQYNCSFPAMIEGELLPSSGRS